jgi:hypothetical protein
VAQPRKLTTSCASRKLASAPFPSAMTSSRHRGMALGLGSGFASSEPMKSSSAW